MSAWWHRPQRIVQINLRQIDANLDPDDLARRLAGMDVTAMLFNVGGIFAWYPTQLPLQPLNPKLAPGDDLLGRMIAAAHAHDIRVIGRYDLSKGTGIAYQAHPDWFCSTAEGEPFEYNGTYQACVNGGWYKNQGFEVLRETLPRYDIDGLFFNMFGYLSVDYSLRAYGLCHCQNCRDGFKRFAGADLPEKRDHDDPLYRAYLRFQDETSLALSNAIYAHVKSLRPDIGISNMGQKSDFFRGEVNRRLDRPQPEWVHSAGEQAQMHRSLGRNRIRHSAALTHFIDFPWRYSAETAAGQMLRLAQQLAHGADPHYYFMGPPDQPDRKPIAAVRELFAFHKKNETRYARLEPLANVGLYLSTKSQRYHPDGHRTLRAFRGAYRALVEAGIPFDVIHDARANEEAFAAEHARYQTIVVSGAPCMNEAEAAALGAYADRGGHLLVIGDAGTRDAFGAPLAASRLTGLPVADNAEVFESRGGYATVPPDTGNWPLDSDVILMDGPCRAVRPSPGSEGLFPILKPQRFGPPELCFPDDPAPSDLPAAIVGPAGDGWYTYVPWRPDLLYHELSLAEHGAFIAHLALRPGVVPPVELSEPGRVEVTVQRDTATDDILVHLVNYSGHNGNGFQKPVTLHDLEITVNLPVGDSGVALVSGLPVTSSSGSGAGRTFAVPPVGYFEVLRLPAK